MKQLLVVIVTVVSLASAPLATRTHAEPQSGGVVASTGTRRLPTLDDAYAVKTIGAVEVSPDRTLAAFEISGGVTVLSLAAGGTRMRRLEGGSNPSWSPDGKSSRFSRIQAIAMSNLEPEADSVRSVTIVGGYHRADSRGHQTPRAWCRYWSRRRLSREDM